ncbi:MAG: hypothetical protein ACJ8G7_09520 [Rhizobacter sp.]
MLVLVQFPFADLRPFAGSTPPAARKPNWRLPPDPIRPDFVRGFGSMRKRANLSSDVIVNWPGEAWYAGAGSGLRLPELTAANFPSVGFPLAPRFVLRRLYSDGVALWRLEIGIAFEVPVPLTAKQAHGLIHDVLAMPVRVRRQGKLEPERPLVQQAESLETALTEATRTQGMSSEARAIRLRAGRPLVLLETHAGSAGGVELSDAVAPGARHLVLGDPDVPASRIDIEYATLDAGRLMLPLVWMRSSQGSGSQRLTDARIQICRLHAEREVLTHVLRAADRMGLTDANPAFERYLAHAHQSLFAEGRLDVERAALGEVFSVYDEIAPGEKTALFQVLRDRRQSRERAQDLVQSYRVPDDRPIIVLPGGHLDMSKTINVGGDNYGQVVFENTGTLINNVQNQPLKEALADLNGLARQLAQKTPDPGDRENVVNNTEAFAKAAAAAKPDRTMLQITGKGLIEAAKTVAEMAAPITTAVTAVLGLLGLAL